MGTLSRALSGTAEALDAVSVMTDSPYTLSRSVRRSAVMPRASTTACASAPSTSNALMLTVGWAARIPSASAIAVAVDGPSLSLQLLIHHAAAAGSSSAITA